MTRNSKILYTNFVALFVLNHANEIFVLKGHDLKLNCPDTPVNSWLNVESFETIVTCENGLTQVNLNLSFSSKILVTKECNIEIKNFTGKEVHQIQCFTSEESYKFNITLGGLTVDEANEFGIIRGVAGKYVSLTCRLNGHFAEQNIFFLKGSEIMAHSPSKVLPIKFVASKADHQQFYVCFVNNTTDGKQFNKSLQLLLVLTPNVTIHTSPDTTVMEGEQLELFCKDESGGIQDHTEFKWTHYNVHDVRLLENHNRIIITRSNRSDAGQYKCTAENDAGNDTDVVKVTVQFAPVVKNHTLTFYSVANTRLLVCNAYGIPKVQKFGKWKHFSSSDQFIRYLNGFDNGTLLLPTGDIIDSKYEDSGIYECRASNNIIGRNGDYWQTGRIKVIIRAKPVLAKPFSTEFYGHVNNTSVMTVIVLSSTKITNANWLNKQTNNTGTVRCNSDTVKADIYDTPVNVPGYRCMLKIQNTTENDFSVYFVFIANRVGSSAFEICLKSASSPQIPIIYHLSSGSNHISLEWKPGCDGGCAQSFIIEYRKSEDIAWIRMQVTANINTAKQVTTISNTEPDSEYHIRMYAYNCLGNSSFTKDRIISTKDETDEEIQFNLLFGVLTTILALLLVVVIMVCHFKQNDHCGKVKKKDQQINYREAQAVELQFTGNTIENSMCMYQSVTDLVSQEITIGNISSEEYLSEGRNAEVTDTEQVPYKVEHQAPGNDILRRESQESMKLNYIEVVFEQNQQGRNINIHGADKMTPYADIDFSAKAEPMNRETETIFDSSSEEDAFEFGLL